MERTLVLMRHAKSDWDGQEADIDRPLASRGRRQATEAGEWLAEHLPAIDLAVLSPAVRVAETWQLVSGELATPPATRIDDRVYAASAEELLTVVRDVPAKVGTAVLVGHNPGLEELVHMLTGQLVPMPTSAIAVLIVHAEWSAVESAVLNAAGRPPLPTH